MNRFVRGVFLTFTTQIICLLLALGGNVIITRILGPSGKGIITLITNYFLILVTFFTFGIGEGIVYYHGSRKYNHGEIFSSILLMTVATSLLAILFSIVLRVQVITTFLKEVGQSNYLLALLIFPAFYFFLLARKFLLSHKDLFAFNLSFIARAVIAFALYLLLIPHFGIKGAILSMILSLICVDVASGIYLSSRYGSPNKLPSTHFIKDSFVFGIKSQIGIVLNFFDRRLDMFIINIFLNPASVGFYAIAVALAELPWRISDAIGTVLFPKVTGMKKQDAYRFISLMSRNSVLLTLLFSTLLFIFGGVLIELLFGTQFRPSLQPLRILLPGIVFLGLNRVLCGGFSGLGKPEYGTLTVVCSSVTTIILDIILIPRMGIIGAALASTIAYAVSAVVGVVIFQRISGYNVLKLIVVTKSDITLYRMAISNLTHRRKYE